MRPPLTVGMARVRQSHLHSGLRSSLMGFSWVLALRALPVTLAPCAARWSRWQWSAALDPAARQPLGELRLPSSLLGDCCPPAGAECPNTALLLRRSAVGYGSAADPCAVRG